MEVREWAVFSDDGTQVFLTTYNQLKDSAKLYRFFEWTVKHIDFTAVRGKPS